MDKIVKSHSSDDDAMEKGEIVFEKSGQLNAQSPAATSRISESNGSSKHLAHQTKLGTKNV
jgi:hypothetical protein